MRIGAIDKSIGAEYFISSPAIEFASAVPAECSAPLDHPEIGRISDTSIRPPVPGSLPPFSLSATAQILQASNLFLHFAAGELLLPLILLLHIEAGHQFRHGRHIAPLFGWLSGIALAAQVNQLIAHTGSKVQIADRGSPGGPVGIRLDMLA